MRIPFYWHLNGKVFGEIIFIYSTKINFSKVINNGSKNSFLGY